MKTIKSGNGSLPWNAAIKRIMGQEEWAPNRELGERLRMEALVREPLEALIRKNKITADKLNDEVEAAPARALEIMARRVSRLPVGQSDELRNLCKLAGDTLRQWVDYCAQHETAERVLLAHARSGALSVFRLKSADPTSQSVRLDSSELAADVVLDPYRRHLVPRSVANGLQSNRYGTSSPAIFYWVTIGEPTDPSIWKSCATAYSRARNAARRHRPQLLPTGDVKEFFDAYLGHFQQHDHTPSEEQMTLALQIEWPDHSDHRSVARKIAADRHIRSLGRPRKSAKNL